MEVADGDAFGPRQDHGVAQGGVIKLNELLRILAVVDIVCEKVRERQGLVKFFGIGIRDTICAADVLEGDAPHVGLQVAPAPVNSFSVGIYFTGFVVESDFTSGAAEDGHG